MKGAYEVELDDGRIVQLKEMGNGCYVELYAEEENPGTQKHPPESVESNAQRQSTDEQSESEYGYARQGSQYLLKPEAVFRSMEVLPIPTELKLRLTKVLEKAVEWLDEGEGSEKSWSFESNARRKPADAQGESEFDDVTRADKLLNYVESNWRGDDKGILRDVAEALVRENVMLCNRSHNLFTLGEWGRPSGSYVATVAADEASRCPKCGAPKSEFWTCTKSSHRTRVPNRYKCTNCGKTAKGITTG